MFKLPLFSDSAKPKSILLLGAHCDDIEIGCGGAIQNLLRNDPDLMVHWIVFSSNDMRRQEAERSASAFLQHSHAHNVQIKTFKNGYFPQEWGVIKDYFEVLKGEVDPDIIFTHYHADLHQDHRVISELTWNTFRNHLILEYEIAKYDSDLGNPNFFIPLDQNQADFKCQVLMDSFKSQLSHHWFTQQTFLAMMRIRGIQCNAGYGLAEAFYSRKMIC